MNEYTDIQRIFPKNRLPGSVIDLTSIVKYKDPKSVAEALLDDDFTNKTLALIAQAVLKEDKKERNQTLTALQNYCTLTDLKKVKAALDDKGYMYNICTGAPILARQRCRVHHYAEEINLTDIMKELKKTDFEKIKPILNKTQNNKTKQPTASKSQKRTFPQIRHHEGR